MISFGKRRALEKVLAAFAARRLFCGAAVAHHKGRKLLLAGHAMADMEARRPNRPGTRFHIGSTTKMLVALGARVAARQRQLDLHAPIQRYYPELPGSDSITPFHLMTNTAGLPDYLTHEVFAAHQHEPTPRAVFIDAVAGLPRAFSPGEAFAYSNTNWLVLAEVLERALDRTLAELMHELVFRPLGMSSTSIATEDRDDVARGYRLAEGRLLPAEHVHPSALDAAGAAVSTVEDLWTLDWALKSGELLPATTLEEMHTPHRENYGEGVFVDRVHGRTCVYHEGGMFGYASGVYRFPDVDAAVILLCNQMDAPLRSIRDALSGTLFGEEVALELDKESHPVSEQDFLAYRGRYESAYKGRPFIFDIERRGDRYVMDIQRWTTIELTPIGPDRFFAFAKGGEMEATFVDREGGQCQAIEFLWAGETLRARRVADD